jgi:hypothetical protein
MAVFEDDIQSRVMKALQALWEETLCIKLSVLDGNDNALLRWTLSDGRICALTHGPFDYSLNAAMLIQGEFTCGKAEMKVLR